MKINTAARPKRSRSAYSYHSPALWDRIRREYLDGASAPALAEKYGVSQHTIRARANRHGWTKRSVVAVRDGEILARIDAEAAATAAAASAVEAEIADEIAGGTPMPPQEAARAALDEAVKLIRQGRPVEALSVARAAEAVGRAAERLPASPTASQTEGIDDAAAFEAVRRKVLGSPRPTGEP